MDRKVLCKLGSLGEFSHSVIVQHATPFFPNHYTHILSHAYECIGAQGLFWFTQGHISSTLSCECTARVYMGLVCSCSYTRLLGTFLYEWVLSHSLRLLIFMYLHTLTGTHILMCASSPWGSFCPQANSQLPGLCTESAWQNMVWKCDGNWVIQLLYSQPPGCLCFSRPLSLLSQGRPICHM